MTTMSAALNATLGSEAALTLLHLHSINAMVIMQAILGKQLKQRSMIKDQ